MVQNELGYEASRFVGMVGKALDGRLEVKACRWGLALGSEKL